MSYIIVLAGVMSTLLTAAPNYTHPVSKETNPRYESLINLAVQQRSQKFVTIPDKPISYEELRFYALYECKNNKSPDPKMIDMLINVERSFNPPSEMRGMLLAAACSESGYNPGAKGDRKFSKNKRTPMAIGILQLWPIYEKMFPGLDRTNPEQAANAWMKHIVKKIPKVKRQCKYKKPEKVWLAAWVTGIRYKKAGGRCKERPLHYRILKKWHKNIHEDRQVEAECAPVDDGCGC